MNTEELNALKERAYKNNYKHQIQTNMKEIVTLLIFGIGLVFVFLMLGRTTVNGVFPYVHIEYPLRALFVSAMSVLIGWVSILIKH